MGKPSDIELSLANIWKSWYKFRKGKRNSQAILQFEWHLEAELSRLQHDLQEGTYRHGGYEHFIVNEHKRRDIAVAHIRDRVVHRLVYDYLVAVCDQRLDYDVWSCRLGKGNTAALDRASTLLRKHANQYVWRGDVQKFFDHMNHQVLTSLLARYSIGPQAQSIVEEVINSYSASVLPQTGLPIGNLTSQILANIYLHEFDFFVRHRLKPTAYMRYGDDFLLIARTAVQARHFQEVGQTFLQQHLFLTLHKRNNIVLPIRKGVRYLGVTVYPGSKTLSPKMLQEIHHKMSLKNTTSYLSYVQRYGNTKQQLRIAQHSSRFIL